MSSALIITSITGSYFYNQAGRRIGEALRNLGWSVDSLPIQTSPTRAYDWGLLMNTTDLVASCPSLDDALQHLGRVRSSCRYLGVVLLEAVQSPWFSHAVDLARLARVDFVLDGGLYDQTNLVDPDIRPIYRFFMNGLTASERLTVNSSFLPLETRPIPWVMVGHLTSRRANLVNRLVNEFDPCGFVYLARLEPVTEHGPHLNERQFLSVLRQARYQIWCSQQSWFYLEGERFRMSLLSGGVPIKVLTTSDLSTTTIHFRYLIVEMDNCIKYLRSLDCQSIYHRFASEFLAFPSLESSLDLALGSMPRLVARNFRPGQGIHRGGL